MLTLEQTLADQEDIEQLCKQKVSSSKEYYVPNNNYGFAYLMKKYADYPLDEPIYATFPHGIYFRDRVIAKGELEHELPAHLNFPPYTTTLWKKAARKKKVIPFAAPIHYALKLFQPEVPEDQRKGTLFLPKHSTNVVSVSLDKEAVIEELKNLPEAFHPITVCIHWQDVEKGLHRFFSSKGFNVVSAGHLHDDNYMFRWLHLVSQFKLVAHSGLGSALFYSVLAGHPFYLTQEEATTDNTGQIQLFNKQIAQYSSAGLQRMEKLKQLFGEPSETVSDEQRELVKYYTQADLIKSPAELHKQFKQLKALATR